MQFNKPAVERPVHGSINPGELSALGLDPEKFIDFSANINPLGVSPQVKKAMSGLELDHYPDPDCQELRQALSQTVGMARENIVIGNGSTELIHLLSRACLANGSCALILAPTFGEYETACHLADVTPVFVWAEEADGFKWDIDDTCRRLTEIKPQLVFLCNPNNPTGLYLNKKIVQQIAKATAPGTLVIDEAYLPFIEKPWDSKPLLELGNVVLLRSMTKDHALAGLRLGYALAPVQLIEALKLYQPFWSVNTAAQAAGLVALTDREHVTRARIIIAESKVYLYAALEDMGIDTLPSSTNFLLAEVGDARTIRSRLLQHNLCVRDCTSFGLPQYIRLTVRTLSDCHNLVKGLKEVWSG
ncbi:pyridoxal phosphate-dependent aminotransferase [Chloroflexota bacterium]